MALTGFRRPPPSLLDAFDTIARNFEVHSRYLLTFKDGAHLVGIPTMRPSEDPDDPDATFEWQLQSPDMRSRSSSWRMRSNSWSQVFALLMGRRRPPNRAADQTVLPSFQTLLAGAVERHGFAYAEGGDEVVIVLPNTSTSIAAAFAEELRHRIEGHPFEIERDSARITVSIGLASSTRNSTQLTEWANLAKAEAKQRGRNRTVTTSDGKAFLEVLPHPRMAD